MNRQPTRCSPCQPREKHGDHNEPDQTHANHPPDESSSVRGQPKTMTRTETIVELQQANAEAQREHDVALPICNREEMME